MELPGGFPDASAPAAAAPLPDLHPADASRQVPRASDASAAVHPDAVAGAAIPALAAVPYAEKLVVRAPDVRARTAEALPPPVLPAQAEALCIPGAGRSAA
jgi:hypothetical protein